MSEISADPVFYRPRPVPKDRGIIARGPAVAIFCIIMLGAAWLGIIISVMLYLLGRAVLGV